jgi:hypothetical protein
VIIEQTPHARVSAGRQYAPSPWPALAVGAFFFVGFGVIIGLAIGR